MTMMTSMMTMMNLLRRSLPRSLHLPSAVVVTVTMTTMPSSESLIVPDWPAPPAVRSLLTTRRGGVSRPPYASLNLGDHVGDDPA